jgi:hypothetical protein
MPSTPPLPTFIIIGAQKSATRWLRTNLGRHPEVFTAPQEVKFFNQPRRYAGLGVEWYRQQFEGAGGAAIVGEATPGYLMWVHGPELVARRIDENVPDVRLIALLRDPIDRAQSALVHHIREERIHPSAKLLDVVRRKAPEDDWLGVVTGGWYAASLEPYLRLFGDRLLVLLHDDLGSQAREVYRDALCHIGASDDFVPAAIDEVTNSNQRGAGSPSGVTPEERAQLFGYFRDDVDRLELLIGRDLSAWRPR